MSDEQIELDPVVVVARITTLEMLVRQMMVVQLRLLADGGHIELTPAYVQSLANAYAEKVGFVADLAYKTKRLVEQSATQEGLGRLTKSVTFDVKTLGFAPRYGLVEGVRDLVTWTKSRKA